MSDYLPRLNQIAQNNERKRLRQHLSIVLMSVVILLILVL
jgi:hypothetical protein